MSKTARPDDGLTPEERAERLKERIYVTFTSLAVVIVLRSHGEEVSPGSAAVTLLVAVVGTLLAVFVADFVSHLAVHAALPDRDELRHMLRVSLGSVGAIALPLVMVGLAGAGVWTIDRALRASTLVLLVTLVVIGYLAVRRVPMPLWQKLVVLLAELLLGIAVIALELLAHG